MIVQSMRRPALQDTVDQGKFYSISDKIFLYQVLDAFSPELERLKGAYALEQSGSPTRLNANTQVLTSPSEFLYQHKYDEIDRTLVGILALRWIMNDDYATFTLNQPAATKLQRPSFDWLREHFLKGLRTPADIFALVTSMIINDLGKDASLGEDFHTFTGQSIQGLNHDMILFEAAKAGMIPCLDRLDPSQKADLMMGLDLGSDLNTAQLAQGENVLGSLEGLLIMRGHEHAFEMKFMEQLLDVAGAGGHNDPTCAQRMIEPVFQAFKTVYEVALDIISGKSTLREGYDSVLTQRGELLEKKGFQMNLTVDKPEERALLRLLTMGRTADKERAELFADTFYSLPESTRQELVDGLNVDGHNDGTAILPYYMPAMLSEGLENTKDSPPEMQKRALSSLMRFLARVVEGTRPEPGMAGVVVERNLMYARETVASEAFRKDPSVLDTLEIPKGEVLRRRRTSTSTVATEKQSPSRQASKESTSRVPDANNRVIEEES